MGGGSNMASVLQDPAAQRRVPQHSGGLGGSASQPRGRLELPCREAGQVRGRWVGWWWVGGGWEGR